jgi:hypothetical protein
MSTRLDAPVDHRAQLLLQLLHVGFELIALSPDELLYLGCCFAHSIFSLTVGSVRGRAGGRA